MSKTRVLFCGEFSGLNTGYSKYAKEILTRLNATNKYEIAEHGCYADPSEATGRIRSLMQNTPWKVYGNMPSDEQEKVVYDSSAVNAFGAWKFEAICLDFKPHVVCSPPGELVLTHNGYKPIEEIKENDYVLTHKGVFNRVVTTMKRQYSGQMVSVKFNGCKETLKLTSNHPVLVYKNRKQTNQKKSIAETYEGLEPEFIPIEKIKKGDLIVLPQFDIHDDISEMIDISKFLIQFVEKDYLLYPKNKNGNPIHKNIVVDKDLGTLFGYILGDGYIHKSGITITFTRDEERFVEDVVRIVKNKFNIDCKVYEEKDKFATNVCIHSVLLSEFFKKYKFYTLVWWNKNFTEGLIRGLVRSDGCYKKSTVSFCSTNKQLAHFYRILCLLVNIPVNIQKRKTDHKDVYEIEGYGESALKLHNICNKYDKLDYKEVDKSNRSTQIINGYLVASVNRVRKYDYEGQVYNLEVENDNSYIIQQSCVHNCDIRDFWMMSHEENSPFRPYYKLIWMPTVDSSPQNEQWLSSYANADAIFTYNDWSAEILRREGGGKINVIGSTPPSASDIYKPMDKDAVKNNLGLDPKFKIVGMISRNQRRKLYPDLFAGFRQFLNNTGRNDILLYCHTSFPDAGWDIPKLLLQHGLASKVLFTYRCQKCSHAFPAFFSDALTQCVRCNMPTASLPDVQNGVSDEVLSVILNMFDVYVQYANSEGFGIGQVEAAACGVPVMSIDYSAMSDIVRKLKGYPIKVKTLIEEVETGCMRAKPDNDHFAKKLEQFFNTTDEQRKAKSIVVRQAFEDHYNWDATAQKWEECIDSFETVDLWQSPPRIHNPLPYETPQINNHDYIRWLIVNVLGEPERLGSYLELRLVRDLNYGMTAGSLGGTMFSDGSTYSAKHHYTKFKHKEAYDHMKTMCNNRNSWEQRRIQDK